MRPSTSPEARVVGLGCMHAAGGVEGQPLVLVPCGGAVGLDTLLVPLAQGAAGVVLLSCEPEQCRHRRCGEETPCEAAGAAVVSSAREVLTRLGLSPQRVAHRVVRSDEDAGAVLAATRGAIERLGPWARGDVPPVKLDGAAAPLPERVVRLTAGIQALAGAQQRVRAEEGEVFWAGCSALRGQVAGEEVERGWAAERLWRQAGRGESSVIRDLCCGHPLLGESDRAAFAALARDGAELIRSSGARRVVTACAHCARVIREGWREAGVEAGWEVLDFATWAFETFGPTEVSAHLAIVDPPPELGRSGPIVVEAALFSGTPLARLAWPKELSGDEVRGPGLVAVLDELVSEARDRGAEALVLPSAHHAQRLRMVRGEGAWRTSSSLPIFDVAEALWVFGR